MSPTKCVKCGAHVEIWHNIMLCDPCLDNQIKISDLEKVHKKLGETGLDGFQSAGVLSVETLESMWRMT